MKILITKSQFKRIVEQDDWVLKAASGPQRCGRDAKEGGYDSNCRPEKEMSPKKSKKYTENEYWVNQIMAPQKNNSDFQERIDPLISEIESMDSKFLLDQKKLIVYNLTNMLNNSKSWWFRNYVKQQLKLTSDIFNDKNILDFIKLKGGFDGFKGYYLSEVIR